MVFGKFKIYLAAVGAFIAGLFYAYTRGRMDQARHEHEQDLNEYVETRRRIDEGTIPNDAADALNWLKSRRMRDGDE